MFRKWVRDYLNGDWWCLVIWRNILCRSTSIVRSVEAILQSCSRITTLHFVVSIYSSLLLLLLLLPLLLVLVPPPLLLWLEFCTGFGFEKTVIERVSVCVEWLCELGLNFFFLAFYNWSFCSFFQQTLVLLLVQIRSSARSVVRPSIYCNNFEWEFIVLSLSACEHSGQLPTG